MAVRAVAFGAGAVVGQHGGHFGAGAVPLEDARERAAQVIEGHVLDVAAGGVRKGHAEVSCVGRVSGVQGGGLASSIASRALPLWVNGDFASIFA